MDVWYGNVYYKTGIYDEKLMVGGWGDEYDTLIRFNLSGLPQVADQVILWLWGDPQSDSSIPHGSSGLLSRARGSRHPWAGIRGLIVFPWGIRNRPAQAADGMGLILRVNTMCGATDSQVR